MNRTVLIVEGLPIMRRVVERSLRLAGVDVQQVLEASEGQEALHLMENTRPDLILSEISLQGMDGLELLRQVRATEATKSVPLVFITDSAAETQVNEALQLGAQGYIRKPFTVDQIKDSVVPLVE